MEAIFEQIREYGIMPLVTLKRAEDARLIGKALTDCCLPVAEVTFRTDQAEEAIRIFLEEFPQILVGAGTVLTPEVADRAIGCVRSAEGLSAQRESRLLPSLTDIGGFAATRGCTPCAAYAAIPAHPQKQYTRLWRLYHFCGFSFYPGGDTHSHLSL